jgi:predicted metal-dependent enzyme (double-stranded beta helix superfamily)
MTSAGATATLEACKAGLPAPLDRFVHALEQLVAAGDDEPRILEGARAAMRELVAREDWLPQAAARPHPQHYAQHLLYLDPEERFSIVSFVWGPGQHTPVHDHTVWGVIGVLRGGERCERFRDDGGRVVPDGTAMLVSAGEVECVSPAIGDLHRVANARTDGISVSVHAYGGNIGKIVRHVYDLQTGATKEFVSGYSND